MRKLFAAALVVAVAAGLAPAARAAEGDPRIRRGYITSFDATKIVYNLFVPAGADADHPVPIIFQTHGWGGTGQSTYSGFVKRMVDAGYAVITWDQRGFGQSGGEAWVDDPGHEALDVSALIDFVAKRSDIEKTAPNDPVMGMRGGSYAGGIQLVSAAFDRRVDAIVPDVTWNDLRYSLFPGGVVKLGWDELLYAGGLATAASGGLNPAGTAGIETGAYAPFIHRSEVLGTVFGTPDAETLDTFAGRSVAGYGFGHPVGVPTMITQGIPDTLFNVNEAQANFEHVRATGAPVKLVAYCGGHAGCPYVDAGGHVGDLTMAWFDRYVKGNADTDTGAPVEYETNDGVFHDAQDFRTAATHLVEVTGSGTVINTGLKTSALRDPGTPGLGIITTASPSAASDPGTLRIDTGIRGGTTIVGIPRATLEVSGAGGGTHLFLKLVDVQADKVIDLQEAAVRVEGLSAAPQTVTLDMVGVAYLVPDGHSVELQIATSSPAMLEYRGIASVDIDARVEIPTR